MTWAVPTNAVFLARFPEFSNVATALIDVVLAEAGRTVVEDGAVQRWIETDYEDANLYLAAHLLALQGEPQRSNATAAAAASGSTATIGDNVKKYKVQDVEIEYFQDEENASSPDVVNSGYNISAGYQATSYGQRYLELLKRSFPAVCII